MGTWRVAVDGDARVERVTDGSNGQVDFTIAAAPAGIAALAARKSPLRLVATGKLQIMGKRRRALKLRALANGPEPTIADALKAGAELDADAIYRALPYLIDPEWTRGHSFTVVYEVEGVGTWAVHVRDGGPLTVSTEATDPDARVRMSLDTYRAVVSGAMTP